MGKWYDIRSHASLPGVGRAAGGHMLKTAGMQAQSLGEARAHLICTLATVPWLCGTDSRRLQRTSAQKL